MSRKQVWLVLEHHDYEGFEVNAAHASEAGAKKHAAQLTVRMEKANEIRSAYWEPDEPNGEEPVWPDGVPDCDSITVSGPLRILQ